MNTNPAQTFDLFRLTKGKREADICANTLRSYAAQGLPIYRMGRACFVSRTELAAFIKMRGVKAAQAGGAA